MNQAISNGDVSEVRAALEHGFSANTIDSFGWAPLHCAVDLDRSPKLSDATRVEMIQLLLSHGASPNIRNHADFTPLHFAAVYSLSPAVEVLVKAGADVNVRTYNGSTPLEYAVEAFNLENVKCLLENGADPNSHAITSREERGMTPLHLAARGQSRGKVYVSPPDQAEIIKLLLAKGADRSIVDANGRTALQLAQLNNQMAAADVLGER